MNEGELLRIDPWMLSRVIPKPKPERGRPENPRQAEQRERPPPANELDKGCGEEGGERSPDLATGNHDSLSPPPFLVRKPAGKDPGGIRIRAGFSRPEQEADR